MRAFAKSSAFLMVPLMLCALLAHSLLSPRASAQDGRLPSKTGFVDLKKVIEGYRLTVELEAEIDHERAIKSMEIDNLRKKVKEIKADVDAMNPASDAYVAAFGRMRKAELLANFEEEALKTWLQHRLQKSTAKVYADIAACCQEICRDLGLDAICKIESGEMQSESKTELIMRINSRAILAWNKDMDLTGRVLEKLNRGK